MTSYKKCFVPGCTSNNETKPQKTFFIVPYNKNIRDKWFLAISCPNQYAQKTAFYCCEDHFDVHNDIENYVKFKLMGGTPKIKQDVVPHILTDLLSENDEHTAELLYTDKTKKTLRNADLNLTKAGGRKCFVPGCINSTDSMPLKSFFTVPFKKNIREKWFRVVGRLNLYAGKSPFYCCEDHFDLPTDFENYIKYKLVGGPLKIKHDVVPHFFTDAKNKEHKKVTATTVCKTVKNARTNSSKLVLPETGTRKSNGSRMKLTTKGLVMDRLKKLQQRNAILREKCKQKQHNIQTTPLPKKQKLPDRHRTSSENGSWSQKVPLVQTCRICLEAEGKHDLFDMSCSSVPLYQNIENLFNIKIGHINHLTSSLICNPCYNQVTQAVALKLKIEKSETILQNALSVQPDTSSMMQSNILQEESNHRQDILNAELCHANSLGDDFNNLSHKTTNNIPSRYSTCHTGIQNMEISLEMDIDRPEFYEEDKVQIEKQIRNLEKYITVPCQYNNEINFNRIEQDMFIKCELLKKPSTENSFINSQLINAIQTEVKSDMHDNYDVEVIIKEENADFVLDGDPINNEST